MKLIGQIHIYHHDARSTAGKIKSKKKNFEVLREEEDEIIRNIGSLHQCWHEVSQTTVVRNLQSRFITWFHDQRKQ